MALRQRATRQWKYICAHGWLYWLWVFFLIGFGIYAGHKLEEHELWTEIRYSTFQLLDGVSPNQPSPDNTALVLVGDDEYWSKELDGRAPIRRDYIARLVQALDAARPAVIAIDFDLRSPSPAGEPVESPQYWGERQKLCQAVRDVAQRHKIVLPKTIYYNDKEDAYYRESDIYDRGPDADSDCDFQSGDLVRNGNISFGYIDFADDLRQAPLARLEMKNGDPVDSFSQAISRAYRADVVKELERRYGGGDDLPFVGYTTREAFKAHEVSAADLLAGNPEALKKLDGRLVIVSGQWHSRSHGRGALVDNFTTPVGALPGSLVHANYVEAMVAKRLYRPWGGWARTALEIFWSLAVALPFALDIRPWQKFLAVALVGLLVLLFSYVSLVNFYLFYDFFIPTILVLAHGVVAQVCEWRAAARKCEREHGALNDAPPAAPAQPAEPAAGQTPPTAGANPSAPSAAPAVP